MAGDGARRSSFVTTKAAPSPAATRGQALCIPAAEALEPFTRCQHTARRPGFILTIITICLPNLSPLIQLMTCSSLPFAELPTEQQHSPVSSSPAALGLAMTILLHGPGQNHLESIQQEPTDLPSTQPCEDTYAGAMEPSHRGWIKYLDLKCQCQIQTPPAKEGYHIPNEFSGKCWTSSFRPPMHLKAIK